MDTSLIRFCNEIIREIKYNKQIANDVDNEETNNKLHTLNLYIILMQLDDSLLNLYVIKFAEDVRLTPEIVNRELAILRELAQPESEVCALESIKFYESNVEYIYSTGCRAPLSRQIYGDICYLEVKPIGKAPLYITASSHGYFLNNGPKKKTGELDYNKNGNYYRDLVSLLGDQSKVFEQQIAKLKFQVKPRPKSSKEKNQPSKDQKAKDTTNFAPESDPLKKESDLSMKSSGTNTKLSPSTRLAMLDDDDSVKKGISTKKTSGRKTKLSFGKSKKKPDESDESLSDTTSESEEEEETLERREVSTDLPTEYWQIQKLVKYLKVSNQTATVIFLCCMRDFNLSQETCQLAIRDLGGLEILINLLDTDEIKCKIGSLQILKEISDNPQVRRSIADLGGLQTMVNILQEHNKDLKCLAAETIANVAKFQRARRTVRKHGGIKQLVKILNYPVSNYTLPHENEKDIEIARCGALALWSISKSKKNKKCMRQAGAIPLLGRLLKSHHENMLIPVVGTLQECASEPSYRAAIHSEGMIEDLVKNLKSQNEELKTYCALAIFKCAEDKDSRELVREYGGLPPLVAILSSGNNKELLAAATGAIWKCSISRENLVQFRDLKAIEQLVALLSNQPEKVLVNVVGALGELARDPPNRQTIRKAGGITQLVNLLTGTNQALLINVTRAVGQCAEEIESMRIIEQLDGVRLLWSLLKNQNPEVISSAAWAICPCIENAKVRIL
ncbi:outer dynein arm-docking complex subunit 2 [Octopus bimaculoides]|uniref:outer dynein arm-docking complex subunit 2 n=1 Tax=Octopus bimaculoides TaxID=37653 RepID=UPI0022E2DA22|nr:outer dynein arm-docking complex subunit 2 [Octopus bimaculoides]